MIRNTTPQLLSVAHPQFWKEALRFPAGFHAVDLPGEWHPLLLVKLPHQFLLTCQVNRGFKTYVVPLEVDGLTTIGLMTAFHDDSDCPLITWTPLADDAPSRALVKALLSKTLTVRLFDEHDRELLAYISTVHTPLRAQVRLEHGKFYPIDHDFAHLLAEAGHQWFSARNGEDDREAISVDFQSALLQEDRIIRDERPELYKFHGAKQLMEFPLIKLEPGQFQEIDIILLLQRIFRPEEIYHAPRRHNDDEEIADVVVITENTCLIVQAKDSPNSERMLRSSLERKRRKALKQLEQGCNQVRGAINYINRTQPLILCVEGRQDVIELGSRKILTLVIVRELFVDEYTAYSRPLMECHESTGFPCIGLEYKELIQYATFCDGESGFVNAYFQVFHCAVKTGSFPRLRFGIRDLFREDGSFRFD